MKQALCKTLKVNTKTANMVLILLAFFMFNSSLTIASAQSSSYILKQEGMDVGGHASSSGTKSALFLSVGPLATGFSYGFKDGEITSANKSIYGMHFSSEAYSLSGMDAYDRDTISLAASENGLITTKMEFTSIINAVTQNLGIDTAAASGWAWSWDTESSPAITQDAQVTVAARAFDGLSWSQWYYSDPFYVDNAAPIFSKNDLVAFGGAINSRLGGLNSSWNCSDNLDTSLLYDAYYGTAGTANAAIKGNAIQDNEITWTAILSNSTATLWTDSTQEDNTYYRIKIIARDDAGNETTVTTNTDLTPDRTAPVIQDLTEITGTEDIDWTYELTSHKYDDIYSTTNLTWRSEMYMYVEDPGKNADDVLKNIHITNGVTDSIQFIVSPNCNTESNLNGNRYGYEDAYIKLNLQDAAGNNVTQDVKINVTAVNDRPEILQDIGSNIYRDAGERIIYNYLTNEDTTASILAMDDYIDDVDNNKSDLIWTISTGNGYYQVGDVPYDSNYLSYFKADEQLDIKVGSAADEHRLYLIPYSNYYGDKSLTINVTDNDAIPTYSSQALTIRVWPVNDPPIISESIPSIVTVNEDLIVTLNLHAYENDIYNEDAAPTYNNNLNWTVITYNTAFVSSIAGENTPDDIIYFTPTANKYGTMNIELRLTDTDSPPEAIYPNNEPTPYVRDPKTTTRSMTLVWYPVNDAPILATLPNQTTTEDTGATEISLAPYKISDVEDVTTDLHWSQIDIDKDGYVDYVLNDSGNLLTITPRDNVFGTVNVTVHLTDTDEAITFVPYTPNPLTVTKSFEYRVMAVNDTPTVSAFLGKGSTTQSNSNTMYLETILVSLNSIVDIGYADDTISDIIGGEYVREDEPYLDHVKNSPLYGYRFKVAGIDDINVVTASRSYTFTPTTEYEGNDMTIESYPFDAVSSGSILTQAIHINARPAIVSSQNIEPQYDYWSATQNLTVSWNLTTDAEDDPIYYRIKLWKVDRWDDPIPAYTNTANIFYDSSWQHNLSSIDTTTMGKQFDHGTYYWTVYSANKYLTDSYDYRDTGWQQLFHVDIIAPTYNVISDAIAVPDLASSSSSNPVQFAGRTMPIYGPKPHSMDDEEYYSVWMQYFNEQMIGGELITSSDNLEIVPLTNASRWYYLISFPNGTTTYNIYFMDRAGNTSNYQTFVIGEDTTPPMVPILSTHNLTLNNGVYEAICSQSTFCVTGQKDPLETSSIWYSGYYSTLGQTTNTMVYGLTSTTNFTFYITPTKPSGNITAKDFKGNISDGVSVHIRFIIGTPTINVLSQSRVTVNSQDNPRITWTETTRNEVCSMNLSWQCSRQLSRYDVLTSGGQTVSSGNTVLSETPVNTRIYGNNTHLTEGDNILTLRVFDEAYNAGTVTFNVKRMTEPPTCNNKVEGLAELSGQHWILTVRITEQSDVSASLYVNSVRTSMTRDNFGIWQYRNDDYNMAQHDMDLVLNDAVYNTSGKKIWNHLNYVEGQTTFSVQSVERHPIIFSYASLPINIQSLEAAIIRPPQYNTKTGMALSMQTKAFEYPMATSELIIPKEQTQMYQIYAKRTDNRIDSNVNLDGCEVKIACAMPKSIYVERERLIPLYFNPETNQWENPNAPFYFDLNSQKLIITIHKTGLWTLGEFKAFNNNLNSLRVYPNPWRPFDLRAETGDLEHGVVFDNLTQGSRVRIYTVSGQLVRDESPQGSSWVWDGKNTAGNAVFSGVYIYMVSDETIKKIGKITIIR